MGKIAAWNSEEFFQTTTNFLSIGLRETDFRKSHSWVTNFINNGIRAACSNVCSYANNWYERGDWLIKMIQFNKMFRQNSAKN